jgi:hypothetical protein
MRNPSFGSSQAAPAAPAVTRRPARANPAFVVPKPNRLLMGVAGFVARWALIRGRFRVRRIHLPAADFDRLRTAVNPGTAAFLAPNHPEFGFDWMMDKELSTRVAPRMASWAASEIVRGAPWFWRRHNLIANDGGAAALRYSEDCACAGDGVLLHPEGSVHWTASHVHPLFPGIADLAINTAARLANTEPGRPTFIVPVVWMARFTGDVSRALLREMNHIAAALGLPEDRSSDVVGRFSALQEAILARQMARFGFARAKGAELDYFDRQEAFRAQLVAELRERHQVGPSDSVERTIHRLQRAIAAKRVEHPNDPQLSADAARVAEALRLGGFSRTVYGTAYLTQEQISECLQRHRATLMKRGRRNALYNMLPRPHGPRLVRVRVPEPIRIDQERALRAAASRSERAAYVAELLAATRTAMQQSLDTLSAATAGREPPLASLNPFASSSRHAAA